MTNKKPAKKTKATKDKISLKEKIKPLKAFFTSMKGIITSVVTFVLLIAVMLIMKACEPAKGSALYGTCSAFLEQQIQFPETIEHNYVEQYSTGAVRVYYSHIDGFGQYLTELVECSFGWNAQDQLEMKSVIFNTIKESTRKKPLKNKGSLYAVEQEHIDAFNKSLSIEAIMGAEPDLTLPAQNPLFL